MEEHFLMFAYNLSATCQHEESRKHYGGELSVHPGFAVNQYVIKVQNNKLTYKRS